MLIDAFIIGFIALLSTLGNEIPCQADLYVALKAFGLAFFMQVAIERGLKKPQPESE